MLIFLCTLLTCTVILVNISGKWWVHVCYWTFCVAVLVAATLVWMAENGRI